MGWGTEGGNTGSKNGFEGGESVGASLSNNCGELGGTNLESGDAVGESCV